MLLVIHNQPADGHPRRVFVSYSHQDESWRHRVVEALKPLEQEQRIAAWYDRKLLPGQDWDGEIRQELNQADVILFLVSPAFIKSSYCRDVEVRRAVERSDAGEAVLVPIIIHRCEFQKEPFARFQAYPIDGSPLAEAPDQETRLGDLREKLHLALLGWWYPRRPRGDGGTHGVWQLQMRLRSDGTEPTDEQVVRRLRELADEPDIVNCGRGQEQLVEGKMRSIAPVLLLNGPPAAFAKLEELQRADRLSAELSVEVASLQLVLGATMQVATEVSDSVPGLLEEKENLLLSPSIPETPDLPQMLIVRDEQPGWMLVLPGRGGNATPWAMFPEAQARFARYLGTILAVPDGRLTVNLSTYEPEATLRESLARTELGHDLMEQDCLLKQYAASLLHPDHPLGRSYWEGKVLPICLEEIHRSRPYFIGLLGERYGWIPDSVPQEVIAREPWLQQHVGGRTSVTELEILHGVLNNPNMASHAFFYFRDPAYLEKVPKENRQDFATEDLESQKKLEALKERIRLSGMPVLEKYPNPEALAAAVSKQFIELIGRLYPKEEVPDPLDQESLGHEAFAARKLMAYVERPVHTSALNDFVAAESTGQGLVLTGESGGGKTALLASWLQQWRQRHPDDIVVEHYFGATPESASVDGFLRRLLGELKRRYDITDEIPVEPDKLREALPLWLAQTVGRGRIVLVLDALNQIEGSEPDRRLGWLPRYFPPHVRVLASALPGHALETLGQLGWAEHLLPPADPAERERMITTFLSSYVKILRSDLNRQVAAAPGSANPLFLRTVLEELRQFGSFDHLPERVAHYLKAKSPQELFRLVLRRWQEDFDGGRDLVCRTLSLLWAARQGLTETEWLELLGTTEKTLPRQEWAPLFFAMEPHLTQRVGLYAFGHDFLRHAVQAEFLPCDDDQIEAHLMLAGYFEHQPEMTSRKAAEWPWQLRAAEAWERFGAALTDIELFLALSNDKTKWEITDYWHPLRAKGMDLGHIYALAFERWLHTEPKLANNYHLPHQLGSFLLDNGCYLESEPLLRRSLEGFERVLGLNHPDTLKSMNNLAGLLESRGNFSQAELLHRRALESYELLLGKEHPSTLVSVNNLAGLLHKKADYGRAESLYRRALECRERVLGKDHSDTLTSVHNLATLLHSKGDYAQAESLYWCVLDNQERTIGKEHPKTLSSVANLSNLLISMGNFAKAEPLCRRALEGRERVLGKDHPDTLSSLANLANLLYYKGDYAESEPLYRQALEGRERVLGKDHPSTLTSVNNLAELLKSKGDYGQAEYLLRRALDGSERVLGKEHPETLTSLNNLAELLRKKGEYAQAEPLYQQALEAKERVLAKHIPTHSRV